MTGIDTNTSFSMASAQLAIGISHLESTDELFQLFSDMSREQSLFAKEQASAAHDDNVKAALLQLGADLGNASASVASGGASFTGAARMKAVDPEVHGSQAYKDSVAPLDTKIGTLNARKNELSNQFSQSNGKPLDQVTPQEVQGWETQRAKLQRDTGPDGEPVAAQELQQLDQKLNTYNEYKATNDRLEVAKSDRARLGAEESQRLSGIIRLQTDGASRIVDGVISAVASLASFEGRMAGIDADKHNELREWASDRASAMSTLAGQMISSKSDIVSSTTEVRQTQAGLTERLTRVD